MALIQQPSYNLIESLAVPLAHKPASIVPVGTILAGPLAVPNLSLPPTTVTRALI